MKTKKLLSIMLAIIMVVSMMATMGISANAGKLAAWIKVEKYGKTFWYRTDKVTHNDGEHDESWECECWDLIVGKFAYAKQDEYDDGDWYDVYPCEHLVEYEPLTSLVMKDMPEKTSYAVGETLNLTGAKMTATTISETTEDVNITSSMVSGFDSTTAGTKTVTVKYRNLTTSFDVTVAPQNECYLDLDSTTTDIKEKKELDQNYNLTVNEGTKTDVTKVKLSWEIKDINATRTDNKVWDTENLCWKTDSSSTTINQQGTAKFTLENHSSVKVNAAASFKAEGNFKGTASYDVEDGKVTLDTANGNDTYSKTNVPTKVINATITTAATDFDDKETTATAKKYGTYTVTIAKASTSPTFVAGTNITTNTFSVKSNNLDINIGDKWSDVITNNVGKTMVVTLNGDDYACTLQTSGTIVYLSNDEIEVYLCTITGSFSDNRIEFLGLRRKNK